MARMKRWLSAFICFVLLMALLPTFSVQVKAASSMRSSQQMIDVLKKMEGFSAKPYWDYAQWTVGYGTRCPDDKLAYYTQYGISLAEAQALLQQALSSFETAVNQFIDQHGLTVNQHQFDAMVSFSYNCGTAWMSNSAGYFNAAVRGGDTGAGIIYGLSLFSTAGGDYILIERRLCEANMYLNGIYKASNESGETYPSNYKWVFLNGGGAKVRFPIYAYDANLGTALHAPFTQIPTGIDQNGKPFVYELAGWYTQDGRKVETLDSSLKNGQVLYARWLDNLGNVANLPTGQPVSQTVKITGESLNIRSGPGTYYDKVGTTSYGVSMVLTEVYDTGSYTWGKTNVGWIRLDYTDYVPAVTDTFPKSGTVNDYDVNYRTGPGTNYTRVGKKQKGDRVTITETAYGSGLYWGKMSDGNWICLDYVTYDSATVTKAEMVKLPAKTDYGSVREMLHLEGSVVVLTYSGGTIKAKTLMPEEVTGFTDNRDGTATVTALCENKTVSFKVSLNKHTIRFVDWNGAVISEKTYLKGQTVTPPKDPVRPADKTYTYAFAGWDQPVEACSGDQVYTATYTPTYIDYKVVFKNADGTVISEETYHYAEPIIQPAAPEKPAGTDPSYVFRGWDGIVKECRGDVVYTAVFGPEGKKGDLDGNDVVNGDDATYLLLHVMFGQECYPLYVDADFDGSGSLDEDDAEYLFRYTLYGPSQYPLG